jgi:peptide/nickel transport system ATP-binding protein
VHTIGNQIIEAILLHSPMTYEQARDHAVGLLRRVGIPRPEKRVDAYTFELSGGMRQRACIAMALSCRPSLLIADEPTTALDVTTQANILDLMGDLQSELEMTVMFITHDLGVVAEIADDVIIMYLGVVVEQGDVDSIFHDPRHPYTRALLESIPRLGASRDKRLASIPGMVPHPFDRPPGCPFHTRCADFMPGVCDRAAPAPTPIEGSRMVRCFLYSDAAEPA